MGLEEQKTVMDITRRSKRTRYIDIADYFTQLSSLLESGVSTAEAMELMCEGWEQAQMTRLARQFHGQVAAGRSLSEALAAEPSIIPPFITAVVAQGERDSELSGTLASVAQYLNNVSLLMPNQPSKLKRVFYYPLAVLAVVFIVSVMLLVFVVPQFAHMFSGFGSELPALTKIVLSVSEWFTAWFPLLLLLALLLLALWRWGIPRSASLQSMVIRLILIIPGYRQLYRKSNSSLLLTTWGFLLSRGMKLSEVIRASAQLPLGPYWRQNLLGVNEALTTAKASQITRSMGNGVTPRLGQLLALSNRLGTVDSLFLRQGEHYRKQVEDSYRNVVQLFEPLMIAIIGLIVGTLVLAMYLPIFKMGDVV